MENYIIDPKAGIIGIAAKPGEPVYYYHLTTKKSRYVISGERLGVCDPATTFSDILGNTLTYPASSWARRLQ
jgi:hypothetical protein